MALIVEDGTAKADAEAYISVANAETYLTSRGDATFGNAASDAVREVALRNATDFMLGVFRFRWAGYRYTTTQALDWPRIYVPITDAAAPGYGGAPAFIDYNVVPALVQQACADLAVRALVGPLAPDISRVKRAVQIGPLKVEYDPNMPALTTYVAVFNKLAPLFQNSSGNVGLTRT